MFMDRLQKMGFGTREVLAFSRIMDISIRTGEKVRCFFWQGVSGSLKPVESLLGLINSPFSKD